MALFFLRTFGYKLGMCTVIAATLMAVYGVIAPGWMKLTEVASTSNPFYYTGLWFYCSKSFDCHSVDLSYVSAKFQSSLFLALFGLLLLTLSSVYAIVVNFLTSVQTHRRYLETGALLGGLSLFAAGILWIIIIDDDNIYTTSGMLGPSFYVSVVAAGLGMSGGAMILRENRTPTSSFGRPTGDMAIAYGRSDQLATVQPTNETAYYAQGQANRGFAPPTYQPASVQKTPIL